MPRRGQMFLPTHTTLLVTYLTYLPYCQPGPAEPGRESGHAFRVLRRGVLLIGVSRDSDEEEGKRLIFPTSSAAQCRHEWNPDLGLAFPGKHQLKTRFMAHT